MGDMAPPPPPPPAPGRASHSAPNHKTMGLAGFYCETFKILNTRNIYGILLLLSRENSGLEVLQASWIKGAF